MLLAHSSADEPGQGEPLEAHLREVGERAAVYAAPSGWPEFARAAGLLHDIGKASYAFQDYISGRKLDQKGPDHSTAGARVAEELYGSLLGRIIAYGIAGHHAGLANYADLHRRIAEKPLADYSRWTTCVLPLPEKRTLAAPPHFLRNAHQGFSEAFLIRMLFSCLVDADFLATERFYMGTERPSLAGIAQLEARLSDHFADMPREDSALNRLRSGVREHSLGKAGLSPGLFTLTVPTGGGKTLTSLAFALAHARMHGLARVIYVIPYTSIIEQTASVFREALGTETDVLEHHASFDWEPARQNDEAVDDEGAAGLTKLRKASENWDAPVVVTTAVQFFESLFARRTTSCRKLHNIANAVVVLDEAQTLPLRLLRPCLAALNELAANYRTSIVLCTATQPALRACDGFADAQLALKEAPKKVGLKIDGSRELAPEPKALYAALKRVEIIRRPGKTSDAEIAARFADEPRMLCIVNSRRHARDLFDLLKTGAQTAEGTFHLTTLMCPVHRRAVLAEVKRRLDPVDPKPVRLVSTSLIEAGVDIDFPEVWRALAGLDSIAQAAGRCNREGRMERGQTVVFEPEDGTAPRDLRPLIEAAEKVFRDGLDPLSPEGVSRYFQEVYWRRGAEGMDAATLEGRPWPILTAIAERSNGLAFEFETIAQVFCLIEDTQETVIVPYDKAAEAILARVGVIERASAADLRKLQQYVVSIPKRDRDLWLAEGVLRPVNTRLGAALLCFENLAHYRAETGVDLRQPERRDSESNIC